MQRTSIYRRLTRRRRTPLGYSQLWLGSGYILLVKSSHFTEDYRRFALADIQAIVVTELPSRTVAQVIAAAAALAWTLGALAVISIFGKMFFVVTGAVALASVTIDITRGARCRCHVYTAVSRELLAPVSRMRVARVFLDRVRPAIEAVQGSLSAESVATLAQPGWSPMRDGPPEVPHATGYLPETLFTLFVVDAVLIWVNLRFPKWEVGSVLVTTFMTEVVLIVVALVRRGRYDPRRVTYGVMIAVIVCLGWDVVSGAQSLGSWWGLVTEAAKRGKPAPQPSSFWASRGAALFASGWRMAAGVVGLVASYFERRRGTPQ